MTVRTKPQLTSVHIRSLVMVAALLAGLLLVAGCSATSLRSGWQALVAEDYPLAVDHLESAVESNPDDWRARMYLGMAHAETDDLDAARREWVAALNDCGEARSWNQVVEVMEAYGVDDTGGYSGGEPVDMMQKRETARERLIKEDPGKRHTPKFVWWGVALVLVGTSLAAR